MKPYKLFQIDINIIAAETAEQAIECFYKSYIDVDEFLEVEAEEVPFDRIGYFETERGYEKMTFAEFLSDFKYKEPQIVCWNE